MFNVSNNPILYMPVTFKRNGAVDKLSLFTKKRLVTFVLYILLIIAVHVLIIEWSKALLAEVE